MDLDGALEGTDTNVEVVGASERLIVLIIQVGGGIRDMETIEPISMQILGPRFWVRTSRISVR